MEYGNRAALWIWAFGSVVLVVLVLALMPTVPHLPTTGWDKTNHLLAFAVLAWLGCLRLSAAHGFSTVRSAGLRRTD